MGSVHLGFILAKFNHLAVCAGDVGNAFLNGFTKEKVYIIAGQEFGPKIEGKRLIVYKSIYGLKSSGARFHEHLSSKLRLMGYQPSKADTDLWIKKVGDHYEYIARYVDDVISFSKNPLKIMKDLEQHYVMKGVGKPQYYLGGDVLELSEEWHKEGITTAFSAETYIKNCLPKLAKMCDLESFPKAKNPFADDYHPELDESGLCGPIDASKYRSLIGSANWIITLGRFDIAYAISTLARYSVAPRTGHFQALTKVFGYLRGFPKGKIMIDISDPEVNKLAEFNESQEWCEFYPDAREDVPDDRPAPRGNEARLLCYVDADHARDKLTRRSVTGLLLLVNNTPIHWISKRQKTVEAATYGSELIAARIAVEEILAMRYNLMMLGVMLEDTSTMLGDNMSVIINTTLPSSTLKKKHQGCAYHKVRETIAARIIRFGHVRSTENVADLLTKPLVGKTFHYLTSKYLFRRAKSLLGT